MTTRLTQAEFEERLSILNPDSIALDPFVNTSVIQVKNTDNTGAKYVSVLSLLPGLSYLLVCFISMILMIDDIN